MNKIMLYCQHVLGMGHFMRSMALIQGLSDDQICFMNGGEIVPGLSFPPSVEVVNLPALQSEANFTTIRSVDGDLLESIQAARRQCLLDTFERFKPDLLLIELFPFGRKKFAYELVPLLARARRASSRTKVVCSLRDILVAKRDQERHETRVCALMNRYFDALFIHSDPDFQRLEETFFKTHELKIPIHYTGYVVQSSPLPSEARDGDAILKDDGDTPLILVSIGGGRVGYNLLDSAISASAVLGSNQPHQMIIFTGPYLPDDQFAALQDRVQGQAHIQLQHYTTRFLDYMERADLSISMAGYNTCMNILSTGTRALVLPFTGGGNAEQTTRATKLEALGALDIIGTDELHPQRLTAKIEKALSAAPRSPSLNLHGVENTAACIAQLLSPTEPVPVRSAPQLLRQRDAFQDGMADLRSYLETCQEAGREWKFFLRDDDVDEDEETLRRLLELTLSHGLPLNLELIPSRLTDAGTVLLDHYKRFCPTLIELHQHGWRHVNHEPTGRKCEFGPSRHFHQQFEDIAQGKTWLEARFPDRFYPAFTPPWNRCTEETYQVLDELGFQVLSKDNSNPPVTGYRFRDLSITLDLYRWKEGATLKAPREIVQTLMDQLQNEDPGNAHQPIGLMLHHKVMDLDAFTFLERLLDELSRHPMIRFYTLQELNQAPQAEDRAAYVD